MSETKSQIDTSNPGTKEYAGDITPQQAWDMLESQKGAQLVDVRTNAEWAFVGLPDLSVIDKFCHQISWTQFPDMSANPAFLDQLAAAQTDKNQPVLFLCRSGVRSIAAAIAATAAGYTACYNILDGFEGDHDSDRHRGIQSGWKVSNLNWIQN